MSARKLVVGADIGGTFTDLVIIDQASGDITNCKTLTTPAEPERGVLTALREGLEIVSAEPGMVERFVHATTLPTNLVLERKGARVAFLATEGFGDMFQISRQYPSGEDRFRLRWQRPPSLVDPELTIEVRERLNARGETLRPVDIAHLDASLDRLLLQAPEAFAVCLMHAYVNDAHERVVADHIRGRFPNAAISLSSRVWPEFREYERASATVLSAYVGTSFGAYIHRLDQALRTMGVPARLQIMQSSGAVMGAAEAAERAVYAIESGPAAGVIAAAHVGRTSGRSDLISFDMGGTTAKAGLVSEGRPRIAQEFRVGGHASSSGQREDGEPIRVPVIDLAEVGAGGGSIAWVDAGGHLRLGPQSAGSDPGPACYANGGTNPTTTDANLVLGYLDARYFNAGKMRIEKELAERAIREKVADPLGLSVIDAARGIHSLANALMGAAIRIVTLQRGIDPRDRPIVAFGGAGPLHIVHLAQSFDIREVIVPVAPGVKSAFGLLISDTAYDTVRTVMTPMDGPDLQALISGFAQLSREATSMIADDSQRTSGIRIERMLDIAYANKFQTSSIPLPAGDLTNTMVAQAEQDFRAEQFQLFGVESSDRCRIMGIRVRASIATPAPPPVRSGPSGPVEETIKYRRPVWFQAAGGFVDTPVYDRTRFAPDMAFAGPAVVEEADATTIVPPGCRVQVDAMLSMFIEVSAEQSATAEESLEQA